MVLLLTKSWLLLKLSNELQLGGVYIQTKQIDFEFQLNLTCLNEKSLKDKIILEFSSSLLSHSFSLFRVVNTSFLMHIFIVTYDLFIHLFILILLCYFEVCIFRMSSPIGSLSFFYPISNIFLTWFSLRSLSYPVVHLGKEVWLKSSIHNIHAVPRDILTWCETLSAINFQYMSCYLWCPIFIKLFKIFEFYCSEVKKIMDLATSSTVPILYKGIQEPALFLKALYSSSVIPVYL